MAVTDCPSAAGFFDPSMNWKQERGEKNSALELCLPQRKTVR